MRGLAAFLVTVAGWVAAGIYPLLYGVAVGVCILAALILLRARLLAPRPGPALRAAAAGAVLSAIVAGIVGVLLYTGTDLPFDVRELLRKVILWAVTLAALYWLILHLTGAFSAEAEA